MDDSWDPDEGGSCKENNSVTSPTPTLTIGKVLDTFPNLKAGDNKQSWRSYYENNTFLKDFNYEETKSEYFGESYEQHGYIFQTDMNKIATSRAFDCSVGPKRLKIGKNGIYDKIPHDKIPQ